MIREIKFIHDNITYVILNDRHNDFGVVDEGLFNEIGRFFRDAPVIDLIRVEAGL